MTNNPMMDPFSAGWKAFRIEPKKEISIRIVKQGADALELDVTGEHEMTGDIIRVTPPEQPGELKGINLTTIYKSRDDPSDLSPFVIEIESGLTRYLEKVFPDVAGQTFRYNFYYAAPDKDLLWCEYCGCLVVRGTCPHT